MPDILEKAKGGELSRRNFVKGSIAVSATLALGASFVGCSPAEEGGEPDMATEAGGTWIPAACWHNCGGRCVNKALVEEGVVIRQKTDDSHADSVEHLQQRSCVRGHSQQQQCFGADRLKYPMKRKNWEPLTGGDKSLRGKDEWVRISWDEAYQLVADELKNIYDTYGPRSVLAPGGAAWGGPGILKSMFALGGCAGVTDTSSMGTYTMDTTRIGIHLMDLGPNFGAASANDRFDLPNAEWIVFQGCNPAWSSGGSPMYHYYQAKKAGTQFVMISPGYNATAATLDARWIPVRSGTDTAFMIAVAYEMFKLDEAQGDIIDWDFLNTYTVGFDAEHMPADASTNENYKDYLLGVYDGIEKTAEWASEICGTPVEDIRWYAELLSKNNKVMMLHSFSFARNNGAEDVPQAYMTLGAMGGHFGKSGHSCGSTYHSNAGNAGPALVNSGGDGMPWVQNPIDDLIIAPVAWKSIKEKKYRHIGNFYGELKEGEDRDIDIHMIYHEASAGLQTTPNIMEGIEVHRSVEFVLTCAPFYTTQAKYSDIVLPVTTEWERVGNTSTGNREALFVFSQVTEPLFEAKSDQEIGKGVAEALGLDVDELYPLSEKQQFLNKLLGATYMDTSGEYLPLITITADDIAAWECEGEPTEGVITLEEILTNGVYSIKRSAGDAYSYIGYEDYIADPVANPRESASGKFEIYSQRKADLINGFGFSTGYKPYPTYQVPVMGYETTFADWGGKVKGEYPYILNNPHYYRRSHTVFDNIPWLREAWPNPVFISTADAAEKGIETGDTVIISNQWGKVLRTASVLDTLMPGIVELPHGAWVEMDENDEIDLAGADNVMCGPVISGMGISGYNNYNCNIEKYSGTPLDPDAAWPQRIIEL